MSEIVISIQLDIFRILIENLTEAKLHANNYKSISVISEKSMNPRAIVMDFDNNEFIFDGYDKINEFLKNLK